jgi:hypothetical protein
MKLLNHVDDPDDIRGELLKLLRWNPNSVTASTNAKYTSRKFFSPVK